MTDFLRVYSETPLDGKYRILERLGTGGMGEVYKAEHVYLGAIRVIKVIRPQISGSQDANDRFLREARAATRVQHPNVAVLHDFSALPDGSHYMVWEYIDGENLAQRLRTRGTLPPAEAVRIAIEALRGLEAIHRAGIVHRDIGPENLMITHDGGNVKIIDLGVAKIESDVAVTQTGIFVGKLRYAAPEQLGFLPDNERIDARADLYSLGMVLYEMLAGRPPFEGKSPHEYLRIHSGDTALQLVDLKTLPGDASLQAILRKALARDRNKRFQSATEFIAALTMEQRTPSSAHREAAAPTVITAIGDAAPTVVTRRADGGVRPSWVVLFIALAVLAGLVYFFSRTPTTETAATITAAPPAQATPAETSVSVVAAPSKTEAVAPQPVATHTVAPVVTETPAPPPPTPQPQPTPAPAPHVEETHVAAYTEGGDGDANEPLLEHLRSQLHGVNRIALQAGAMQDELAKALQHEIPSLTIADSADVVIRFEGTLEHLGRGRKRRAATASVVKNGRVVFRYEMPSEEYRVGSTPVEAFTDVFSSAIDH